MQEIINNNQKQATTLSISDLSREDRSKLVEAFVWLIKEDKKQNSALYQVKNK